MKFITGQNWMKTRVDEVLLQDNGWIIDNENEEVRPLWFTGTFLISFLHFHSSLQN